MNAACDPDVVARLRKEAHTAGMVRRAHRFTFPKHVRLPGKLRPTATGWEAHMPKNVATLAPVHVVQTWDRDSD